VSDKEYRRLVKRTLIACDGSVKHAAELLGVHPANLSRTLNHRALGAWWIRFKTARQLQRARERGRRAYLRKKERALISSGYPPELARELAARPRPPSPLRRRPVP
jgi:hypothetical protein